MKKTRYAFNIEWSKEDGEYIATCPSFIGLTAFGRTEEEALKEGKLALEGFVQTYLANGMDLPEPRTREDVSGKLQLRLPKSLHRLSIQMAKLENVSLNTYIMDAVRARVSSEQIGKSILQELRTAVASALTVQPKEAQYTKTVRAVGALILEQQLERRKGN